MKTAILRAALVGGAVISVCFSFNTVVFAVADLSDWVAIDTMAGLNNYGLTSATSAGGTFADRRQNEASLSDHTLNDTGSIIEGDGAFDWGDTLSMSGTVTFSNAFDPVMFFGWYNSSNLNERIGMGVANPVPEGTGIRMQTQSGNVAGTGVVSQNVTGSTTTSTFAPGTYSFTFNYDGQGHMTGTFHETNFARNYALPTNALLNMDRFGILQKSTMNDDVNSYTFSISDLTYTGQTDFVEAGQPGDHNNDGVVDAADYVAWRKTEIDGEEGYNDFVENFGEGGNGSGSGGVPEPSTFVLVLAALTTSLLLTRQRVDSQP
jgi:hypothetical protein